MIGYVPGLSDRSMHHAFTLNRAVTQGDMRANGSGQYVERSDCLPC